MNTPTNAYITKFSSGLLLALLAFSGLLFLFPITPAVQAAVVNPAIAVNNYSYFNGGDTWVDFNFTNPSSNSVAVSSLTATAPSGWAINDCDWSSAYLNACTNGASSVTWYIVSGGISVPPGGTQELFVEVTFASAATYPTTGAFQTTWSDNLGTYHAGPSFNLLSYDSSSVLTMTPSAVQTFTAGGTSISFSASLGVPDAGVPVYFNSANEVGSFTGSGLKVIQPFVVIAYTNTAGTATVAFAPSNIAQNDFVEATIGGGVYCDGTYLSAGFASCDDLYYDQNVATGVNTVAGAATQATITLPGSSDTTAPNHYIITQGTDAASVTGATIAAGAITISIADKFGNAIDFTTVTLTGNGIVVTALSGSGRFDSTGAATSASINCMTTVTWAGGCPAAGLSTPIPPAYYQSNTYGTLGLLSATITTTTFSVTGTSGHIYTSTYAAGSPQPTATPNGDVAAGGTTKVSGTLGVVQTGVPVTVYLDATSVQVNEDGVFANGHQWITTTTDSSGTFSATYTIDTGLGAHAFFTDAVAQPIDGSTTHMWANATASAVSVDTISGTAHGFAIYFFYDSALTVSAKNTVFGSTVWLDIALVDKYGNPSSNTGSQQIQITLTPSAGVLSATNVYIPGGCADTAHSGGGCTSFGAIAWTVPGTAQNLTLTASGVVNGISAQATKTLGDVSPLPTIAVTSPAPIAGVIYASNTNPVFSGQANVSIGYPPSVTIASVSFKIGSGHWQLTGASGGNAMLWSTAPTLVAGLNTIMFNATDSNSPANVVDTPTYTVLVDTTAPTVAFTTLTNSTIANGGAVGASVTVAEGDLNFTSVTVMANGTALPAADIQITGANNLGSSVTYTVAITGLTTGTWVLGLSASSLAGLTGSATQITVHVTVPPNQIFISPAGFTQQTQSGASGVGGSITNQGLDATATVWYQLLNSGNQVVQGPTFVQTFFTAGQSESFFFALQPGLPHGTYTAQVFVTVAGTAESTIFTVTVTV